MSANYSGCTFRRIHSIIMICFLEEQTIPLRNCTPNIDGQQVTIGGLVSTVRTIVTKSGTKMAFVGLEDKNW